MSLSLSNQPAGAFLPSIIFWPLVAAGRRWTGAICHPPAPPG